MLNTLIRDNIWYVWNAKLTETQIFREFSIETESSLFN